MKGNLSTPINKTAALVTSRSKDNYRLAKSIKKGGGGRYDSDLPLPYYKSFFDYIAEEPDGEGNPLPMKSIKKIYEQRKHMDLAHYRRGRLVVLGMSKEHRGRWVCRCDCGRFTIRRGRCFFKDEFDACSECDALRRIQEGYHDNSQ